MDRAEVLTVSATPPQRRWSRTARRSNRLGIGNVALSWVGVNGREEREIAKSVMDRNPESWRSEWLRLRGLDPWADYLEAITPKEEVQSLCASA